MSEEFADLLHGLWGDPALVLDACSPVAYVMDGGMLNLPIAKRPPKHGYKEPHWAPVCLRPAPRWSEQTRIPAEIKDVNWWQTTHLTETECWECGRVFHDRPAVMRYKKVLDWTKKPGPWQELK